ncbi:T9SS type A sorting domain-containing protein [Hymenobacter sp. UYCo722]|uniref:T9SS type A sorting domain-containing protein n=1 Tax=Hymenobacter sp. UYCo722 TaxID=3156335 RepID=UPI003394C2FC
MRPERASPLQRIPTFLQKIPHSMQNLNFTPKLLRQRRFLSFLLPLFALFIGLGSSQSAFAQGPAIDDVELILSQRPVSASSVTTVHYAGSGALDAPYTGYTKLGSASPTPATPAPPLGTYDADPSSNSSLTLSGSSLVAEPISVRGVPANPIAARLRYRVYLNGVPTNTTTLSGILALNNAGPFPTFPSSTLFNATTGVNLLSNLPSGGNYTLEANFEVDYSNGTTLTAVGNPYTATFDVTKPAVAPPGSSTTWIGGAPAGPNNWLLPENWSNGVPSARSSAIIPSPPRPNPPILNDKLADYSVKNLTLQIQDPANAFTTRGIVRVTTATLKIYGDVANGGNGILATTDAPGTVADPLSASAIIVFAGSDQKIDQGRFANLIIQNNNVDQATGAITVNPVQATKSLFGLLEVPGSLQFASNTSAILRCTVSDINGNLLLDTGGNENVDLKNTGVVTGETNTAFVLGILKVQRNVTPGVKETFGGVGVDITILGSATPGVGQITRATGATFSPIVFSGATRPVSIKRSFGVSFSGLQQGFNADVVFHYNNNAEELNTNRDGFLNMYRTTSGSTFSNLGGVNKPDPTTYPGNGGTVEVFGVNNINTITLADYERNPLPVTVSEFDVKRTGNDAVVTWATAQEINNKGFNVQVSTDAKNYRNIGFVASETPNSTSSRSYSFIDTEKNKVGVRYYRLQQVDTDGKSTFFSPRAVTFEGRATEAGIVAYPNPYTSELRVGLNSAVSGNGFVRITDMTGRVVSQQVLPVTIGSNDLLLDNMNGLKNGMYLLNLTLPSGEIKTMKVVKQ